MDQRTDSNLSRRKQKSAISEKPLRQHLKPDAVPSIFPTAPGYLSKPISNGRSTQRATTTSSRLEHQERALQNLEVSFIADDDISHLSLDEIAKKLGSESIPEGFSIRIIDQTLVVYISGHQR